MVRNLRLILIRKFEYFVTFEVCVGICSLCARLFIARMAFFWRTKILEVLFWYVPCHASIPYDKYGWISKVYNLLRILSAQEKIKFIQKSNWLCNLHWYTVIRFVKFNILSRCMPKNLVTEVSLILLYVWTRAFHYFISFVHSIPSSLYLGDDILNMPPRWCKW